MERQFFAQINDQNIVIDVHVVTSEFMAENPERYPGRWIETFLDNPQKTYAGIGYIWNETTQDFEPPILPEFNQDES